MKRKINRVGQNTLTVSLPKKWAEKYGIKQGDEIDVVEEGKNLIILNEKTTRKTRRVVLNLDEFNKMMVNRHIHEFYREGIEEIIINFTKETIFDYKNDCEVEVSKYIKKLIDRFIGMEIISQTQDKIVLQSLITKEECEKIDVIKRRVYFLIKEFFEEFIKAMDCDFNKFHQRTYDYHDNIAKFTYYYLRLLHFSDISDEKKSRLFGLFAIIDGVIDKIRHTSERVYEMKRITSKIRQYLKEILELFIEQFDILLKKDFSLQDLESLIKKRYALVKKVNKEDFSDEEIRVLSECKALLDTINDFSETYVALNSEKYIEEL